MMQILIHQLLLVLSRRDTAKDVSAVVCGRPDYGDVSPLKSLSSVVSRITIIVYILM